MLEIIHLFSLFIICTCELHIIEWLSTTCYYLHKRIMVGNNQLKRWRQEIIELSLLDSPHRYQLIRHLIGKSLHLIQDFYSNTAWVDSFKQPDEENSFYANLGMLWRIISIKMGWHLQYVDNYLISLLLGWTWMNILHITHNLSTTATAQAHGRYVAWCESISSLWLDFLGGIFYN